MNNLEVKLARPELWQGDLVAEVLIDGEVFPEPAYFIDVDDFFSALEKQDSTMLMCGSCGDPFCCGIGVQTEIVKEGWRWDQKFLDWRQVYTAASTIFSAVEELCQQKDEVWVAGKQIQDRLQFYRKALKDLRTRAFPGE